VADDRHRLLGGSPGTGGLDPFARISDGGLRRPLGDRDALQADVQPRIVHHREHRAHAAILLADQPADASS
jgi:hypothetical protein